MFMRRVIALLLLMTIVFTGFVGSFAVERRGSAFTSDNESFVFIKESSLSDVSEGGSSTKPTTQNITGEEDLDGDEQGKTIDVNPPQERTVNRGEQEEKSSSANDVLHIPDRQLEMALRKNLGLGVNDPIKKESMEQLTSLNASSSDIVSLEGLEYAVNLEKAILRNNNISDISALSKLYRLKELDLSKNQIQDIEPFSFLYRLVLLNLDFNILSDLNPLRDLVELEQLGLENNRIRNIEPLDDLISLKRLNLLDNEILDRTPLENLTKLESLEIDETEANNSANQERDGDKNEEEIESSSAEPDQKKSIDKKSTKSKDDDSVEDVLQGWISKDGKLYFYEDGIYKTGWFEIEDDRYYADKLGVVQTGLQQIDQDIYYFSPKGIMQIDWQDIEGERYYFSSEGKMNTGWVRLDNIWYFFSSSGAMQTGWLHTGGYWYYLDASGAMQRGWLRLNNVWYYLASSGTMQTGWRHIQDEWYYLHQSGAMHSGWLQLGNTWYYLASSGAMKVGWQKVFSNWYYLENSGAMKIGWLYSSGAWYYLLASGAMVTGNHVIDNAMYSFSDSGALRPYRPNAPLDDPNIRFVDGVPDPRTIHPQIVSTINAQTLVNKYNALPDNYYPQNLVSIVSNYGHEMLCAEAAHAWNNLEKKASSMGIYLTVVSSVRSRNEQQWLFNSYAQNSMTSAIKYAAYPRRSEHELGYAVDVGTSEGFTRDFQNTPQGQFMDQYAADFGFVLRYLPGKEHITGYGYESWHYRYLGVDLARHLKQHGITLEEYYGLD